MPIFSFIRLRMYVADLQADFNQRFIDECQSRFIRTALAKNIDDMFVQPDMQQSTGPDNTTDCAFLIRCNEFIELQEFSQLFDVHWHCMEQREHFKRLGYKFYYNNINLVWAPVTDEECLLDKQVKWAELHHWPW